MASKSVPFCWLGSTDVLTLLIITGHLCVLGEGIMCFYTKRCYEGSLSREAAVIIMKIKQLQTCFAKCSLNKFSWAASQPLPASGGLYMRAAGGLQAWIPRCSGGSCELPAPPCSAEAEQEMLPSQAACPSRACNECSPLKGVSVVPRVKRMLQTTFCSQVATGALDLQAASYSRCLGKHYSRVVKNYQTSCASQAKKGSGR